MQSSFAFTVNKAKSTLVIQIMPKVLHYFTFIIKSTKYQTVDGKFPNIPKIQLLKAYRSAIHDVRVPCRKRIPGLTFFLFSTDDQGSANCHKEHI